LFAATFGRYFAKLFVELGSPSTFTILEAGAGSGEFACGVLASLQTSHPEVFAATQYVIEEAGSSSRAQAQDRLLEFSDRVIIRSPSANEARLDVNDRPESTITGIVFSNELVDAFPIHRVIGHSGRLRELSVSLDDRSEFVWVETELNSLVAEY